MNPKNSSLEKKLWKTWIANRDADAANALMEYYMYLVNFHTERISSHLPSNVSKDDVRSFGMLGLYDALKKFDPSRDLKFDTYASFRVKGSIMDGLRKEDWLPRSIRDKTKKIEQAAEQIEQQYQREATVEDIAEVTGMSTADVENTVRDGLFANVLSIEDKPKQDDQFKGGIGYSIPDENAVSPDGSILQQEVQHDLAKGIRTLNEKEQLVISLFYQEELTFTEIGKVLELTTSRISQIHKRSIFKLRKALEKLQAVE